MTPEQLSKATGARIDRATAMLPHIEAAMAQYQINTPKRQAAFLAQIGHESSRLTRLREIWGPTPAQSRYEGRKDLGNTQPGDGSRYRGRGLIQVTGRANYEAMGDALGVDLLSNPEQLEEPSLAALSAARFWQSRGLSELADTGDFRRISIRINGGLNGYEERVALHGKATEALA